MREDFLMRRLDKDVNIKPLLGYLKNGNLDQRLQAAERIGSNIILIRRSNIVQIPRSKAVRFSIQIAHTTKARREVLSSILKDGGDLAKLRFSPKAVFPMFVASSQVAIDALTVSLIEDTDPLVREEVAETIGKIFARHRIPYLIDVIKKDKNSSVRKRAAISLGIISDKKDIQVIEKELMKSSSIEDDFHFAHALAISERNKKGKGFRALTNLIETGKLSEKQECDYWYLDYQIGIIEKINDMYEELKYIAELIEEQENMSEKEVALNLLKLLEIKLFDFEKAIIKNEKNDENIIEIVKNLSRLKNIANKQKGITKKADLVSGIKHIETGIEIFKNQLNNGDYVDVTQTPCFKSNLPKCPKPLKLRKKQVFIAMPYRKEFEETFKKAIKPCLKSKGLIAWKAGDESKTMDLMCHACEGIRESNYAIVNISDGNPNVMFELGLIWALGKKTILLKEEKASVPIDLSGMLHTSYDFGFHDKLKKELGKIVDKIFKD